MPVTMRASTHDRVSMRMSRVNCNSAIQVTRSTGSLATSSLRTAGACSRVCTKAPNATSEAM